MKTMMLKRNLRDMIGCLFWYEHDNQCWVPFQHNLCTVATPQLQGRRAGQYSLEKEHYNKIISLIPTNIS